jgi:hypothetical protein
MSNSCFAELEDYPLENLKALPLFPSNRRKLQVVLIAYKNVLL